MTQESLVKVLQDAKALYDLGGFGKLQQDEFFKKVAVALEPEVKVEPEEPEEPDKPAVKTRVPTKPPKG